MRMLILPEGSLNTGLGMKLQARTRVRALNALLKLLTVTKCRNVWDSCLHYICTRQVIYSQRK